MRTLHCFIRKKDNRKKALAKMEILLQRLRLADVTAAVVHRALLLGLDDLEDGIQAGAAMETGISVLVTRNPKDSGGIEGLQVLSPEIALAALSMRT